MKILTRSILVLLILGGVVYFLIGRLQVEVPVAQAVTGTAVDAVTGTIKVIPAVEIRLKTEIQGRVLERPAQLGQSIKKGDLLVALGTADLEISLAMKKIQLDAGLARTKAGYTQKLDIANLEGEILKITEMQEFGQSSASELEKRKRDLEKLEIWLRREKIDRMETLELLEHQIKQLQAQIEKSKIRAPFDGLVTELLVIPGDIIFPGNTVGRLISHNRIVHLTLSEEDFENVEKGQEVTMRFASYPNQPIRGEVTFLAPTADPDQKNRLVFLKADAPPELLVSGLTGEAVLIKARREGTTLVPRRSLIGNRVYVISDNQVEIRKVRSGFVGLNKAEILEGLEPGEWVVLEEQSSLRAGQKVKPMPEPVE